MSLSILIFFTFNLSSSNDAFFTLCAFQNQRSQLRRPLDVQRQMSPSPELRHWQRRLRRLQNVRDPGQGPERQRSPPRPAHPQSTNVGPPSTSHRNCDAFPPRISALPRERRTHIKYPRLSGHNSSTEGPWPPLQATMPDTFMAEGNCQYVSSLPPFQLVVVVRCAGFYLAYYLSSSFPAKRSWGEGGKKKRKKEPIDGVNKGCKTATEGERGKQEEKAEKKSSF